MQFMSVNHVVNRLEEAGYVSQQMPLLIASIDFKFSGLLVGKSSSHELIVCLSSYDSNGFDIGRNLQNLARALDYVASKRPLIAIIVGPELESELIESLSKVARVLSVSLEEQENQALDDILAVLLPLELPDVNELNVDALVELAKYFEGDMEDEFPSVIMHFADMGSRSVRDALNNFLTQVLQEEEKEAV